MLLVEDDFLPNILGIFRIWAEFKVHHVRLNQNLKTNKILNWVKQNPKLP